MPLHAHLLHSPDPIPRTTLESNLEPGITLTVGPDIPAASEVLVAGRPAANHLKDCPDLRALVIPFAGLPEQTREVMRNHPHIAIYNLHHNAIPTAEMAITLLLAAAKFIVPADEAFRQHDWRRRYAPNPSVLLHGKTALILGYGAVGQHVAHLCRALGMRVLATKRAVPDDHTYADTVYPPSALPDLLPQANVVIIALPLTDETRGMLGARELAQLPSRAILVNVGRAAIVQEQPLYEALRGGSLHAAGLDVWYEYPPDTESRKHTPPAHYPFHELENVVMSPHRAGSGGAAEIEILRMTALATLLNGIANGKPGGARVNLERGY